jgi:F0F1-type ATP synthase assembly protein I
MNNNKNIDDESKLDQSLADLQARIQSAKPDTSTTKPQTLEDVAKDESFKKTMRVATDIIGTPIVCGAIGIGVDNWFSTGPFFFLILAFLGVCAGFWNLYKAQIGGDSSVGFKRLRSDKKKGKKTQF